MLGYKLELSFYILKPDLSATLNFYKLFYCIESSVICIVFNNPQNGTLTPFLFCFQ